MSFGKPVCFLLIHHARRCLLLLCAHLCSFDLAVGKAGANAGGEKDQMPKMWRTILVNRLHVHGFIISDHFDRFPDFLREVGPMVASGQVKFVEDIAEGLENAPRAFMGMLQGKNKGKQIVKVT